MTWPSDTSTTTIPIGKACPLAAAWLRWDEGHGAEAGHDADALVDWILEPDPHDLSEPGWQRVLPGRSVARLRDAEAALNTLAGEVILLPLFDRARGSGDRAEVQVVAVVPFRLQRAYLAQGDVACGADPLETCLVGTFISEPSSPTPAPTRTPAPTPTRSPPPTPSGTPAPSASGPPSPSASGSPEPTASRTPNPSASGTSSPSTSGTPAPSASGTPEPSASGTPNPSTDPTSSPSPSPTPTAPTDHVLGLRVPSAIAIPLQRGEANRVEIPVDITSNMPWSVCVQDAAVGDDRGHMVLADSGYVLASPMSAGITTNELEPLDQPTCVDLLTAANDAVVVVVLEQEVGPADRPGPYQTQLLFRVIAGF